MAEQANAEIQKEKEAVVQNGKYYAEEVYSKWTDAVEEFYRREHGRELPTNVKSALGYSYKHFERQVEKELSSSVATERLTTDDLGTFVRHGFEIISAVIPNSTLREILPVQPLERKNGKGFFLDFVMEDAKGPVNAGDVSMDAVTGSNLYKFYSARRATEEPTVLDSSGTDVDGDDYYEFVGTLELDDIEADSVFFEHPELSTTDFQVQDDGNGNLTGDVLGTGTNTIDYSDGSYDFRVEQSVIDPEDENNVEARYKFDWENNRGNVMRVSMKIEDFTVEPEERELLADWLLQSAFELEEHYGIDAEETLLDLLSGQVRAEIDIWGVEEINSAAPSSNVTPFDQDDIAYVSLNERNEDFQNHIIKYRDEIEANSGRFTANIGLAGREVMNLVEGLEDFDGSGGVEDLEPEDIVGPHFRGTWMGIRWFKVPTYPDKEAVLGFFPGQDNFLQAPGALFPWIPMMASPAYFTQGKVLERGILTSQGIEIYNSNGYLKFQIA